MGSRLKALLAAGVFAVAMSAGDLPAEVQAKFIKILASSAGSAGRVVCKNGALAAELSKQGVNADDGSKVAWASSEGEVRSLKAAGKLVICPNLSWLPAGGAIAIVEEGGKPRSTSTWATSAPRGSPSATPS